jgi:hypothetical protein
MIKFENGFLIIKLNEYSAYGQNIQCDICKYESCWCEAPQSICLHSKEKRYICDNCGNTKIFTEKL